MKPAPPRVAGLLLVAGAGCSFATIGLFNRLAGLTGVGVAEALGLRFALAALLLWGGACFRPGSRVPLARMRDLAGMGGLLALEAGLFLAASRRIPVGLATLLLYLYPALVLLLDWGLQGRRPSRRALGALGLALAGVALALGFPASRLDAAGVALGAGSALGYAVYMALGTRAQAGLAPATATRWITTWAGLLVLVPAATFGRLNLHLNAMGWASVAGLACFGTALPISLVMAGIRRIGPFQTSVACTVEPPVAALLGAAFLAEPLTPLQGAGGLLVLGGVVLLASAQGGPERPQGADSA